ncbi:MAG: tetratricopeptide repeat protein [Gemmataceae bacterium]
MRAIRGAALMALLASSAWPADLPAQRRPTEAEVAAAVKAAHDLDDAGANQKAVEAYARAVRLAEALRGPNDESVAMLLTQAGDVYKTLGRYAQAEQHYQRALKARESNPNPNPLAVAQSVTDLGLLNEKLGRYAQAEPLLQRSLKLYESKLGPDAAEVAVGLSNLAELYDAIGRYAQAEPLYLRSLKIKEAKLGPDDPGVATTLNNLASLYESMARYAQAEPLYLRSLKIKEAKLGRDDPAVATTVTNLAGLYKETGRYAEAEPLYRRSLTISEAKLGRDHPNVATSLSNLAGLYLATGRTAQAEPLYLRSLKIKEAVLGPNHPEVAIALNNLGTLYHIMGEPTKAEPLFRRSLTISEAALGRDHPSLVLALRNLGLLYLATSQTAQAETLFRRSAAITEAKFGPDHPDVALSLSYLAALLGDVGRTADAASSFDRARHVTRRYAARTLPALAASAQADFLSSNDHKGYALALSLALAHAGTPAVVEASAGWVVNGKAAAHEANADAARAARSFDDPTLAAQARRLTDLRGQLAALTLAPPKAGGEADRLRRLADLTRQEAAAAADLGRAGLAGLRADPWVGLDELRAALPDGAVFVDVARFEVYPYNAKPGEKDWQPARYAAWVTPKSGPVTLVDLGPADRIDAAVAAVRQALKDAQGDTADRAKTVELKSASRPKSVAAAGEAAAEKATRGPLDALAKLVLHPLYAAAGGATSWVVSPDADLWLVPWAALPTPDGKYAVESLRIGYAVSGRDPVYARQATAAKVQPTAPLVVADPDFDAGAGAAHARHGGGRGRPPRRGSAAAGHRGRGAGDPAEPPPLGRRHGAAGRHRRAGHRRRGAAGRPPAGARPQHPRVLPARPGVQAVGQAGGAADRRDGPRPGADDRRQAVGKPAAAVRAAARRLQPGGDPRRRRRRADRPPGRRPRPPRVRDGRLERVRNRLGRREDRRGRGRLAAGVPARRGRGRRGDAVAGAGPRIGGADGRVLRRPRRREGQGRGAAGGAARPDRGAASAERRGPPVLLGRIHTNGAVIRLGIGFLTQMRL